MILSRKWLNEFVDVSDISDREFDEAMTLSGSKVETVTALDESLKNVVVGKILSMEKHPDSDHMWICQIDVGQAEPTQIVTGAWNIHVGDLVPVAQHKSLLPNGTKIEKGKLRGVVSNGMLCSLKELSLTAEHDYPYAVITPAALLNDYKPLDPEKPSIPADIKAGDNVFGPVVCGKVLECETQSYGLYHTTLDIGGATASPDTACSNLHAGDLVAYNTKTDSICTLEDLHAEQKEFPHCIADGIFVLNEDVKPGDDMAVVIGADDHVVEFEITPNRPDCLSVIGLAREASATFGRPLKLHTPEVKGCGGSIAELVDIDIEDGDLCPRYTARMVKNVKIQPSPAWMRERLRNSGVRPINNIVDITNYVMLEYGQPMHAFDFSCVEGNHIIVRTAREGETIQTLDGNQRKLTTSMLCICDENKPVCVAGVMGGANSEIVGDTAMVLFESANFNGTSVHRTAAALNMRTDASSRYEKGLDPMNTLKAVERACELVELLGAGEVVEGVMDVIAKDSNPVTVKLEPEKVNGLLIVIYGTEKTLDAYKFNLLRNKQMFINQINNGTIAVRRIDEGGMDEDSGMNFAEFVAILSGNNDLLNKTKLDNKIMQLEKEQAIFKKERIRAERKIAAGQGEIEKAKRTEADFKRDLEYINSYNGAKATLLLNLPQASTEEVGRELHRIAKTYRNGAYGTVGTYAGLNLLVHSEYNMDGTFDRNTFFVEGISGLKYRCGLSGALPLGFVESAQYPHGALSKLPSLIEKQQKAVERIESEIPTLQDIICRQWSKADELSRLKQECKELQHRIDESLKEAEQPQAAKHEAIAEAA